jgi:hypothetical protein
MSDPRNVAHAKKVKQEKEHGKTVLEPGSKKSGEGKEKPAQSTAGDNPAVPAATVQAVQSPGDVEKSTAVLSKLKDLEFHSRANLKMLAELILTIEEELKQKEFAEPIGALYGAQDNFQTKVTGLIESYALKCESMKQLT